MIHRDQDRRHDDAEERTARVRVHVVLPRHVCELIVCYLTSCSLPNTMSLIDRCVTVPGRGSVIWEQLGAIRSVRDREDAIVRNKSARTAKPPDRRVQRTRKLLQDALVSLMIEKGYEATTVQDIIDRANVGRATFYAHFADKETLLVSRLEDLRAMLAHQQQHALTTRGGLRAPHLAFSLAMLEHTRAHLPLYSAIVGRASGAFVLQRIHRIIADLAVLIIRSLPLTAPFP